MARPKQVSDEQLKLAARKVFLESGVNAPVALVAKQLGVTPAALFHRVKSKDQLLVVALWPPNPPELEILQRGPTDSGSPRDQLVAILTGLCSYLSLAVPAIFLLHMGGVAPGQSKKDDLPTMLRIRRALAKWLQQTSTRGKMSSSRAKVLADVFMGTLEARHLHGYLASQTYSAAQNRAFVRAIIEEVTP